MISEQNGKRLMYLKTQILVNNDIIKRSWEGNRQEGQGSPGGERRLQVPDIFISLKRQEETNQRYFFFSVQI